MGSVLSGILGTQNNFQADTGGQNFGQAIQNAQQGINQNFQGQNSLAAALAAQMAGGGPNPAQAMLHQATDNNIKQNTAMMASQRGINPGATQHQAALNAANQGQQAAGQAATMGAQQQLASQGQLGSLYGQIGNQYQGNQNTYQSALGGNNTINSGVAQANANASGAAIGGLLQGAAAIGTMGASAAAPAALGSVGNSSSTSQFGGLGGNYKFAKGGQASGNVLLSPGELVKVPGSNNLMRVPGHARVHGDSPVNDTFAANLPAGSDVVPRSKSSDKAMAEDFISHITKTQGGNSSDGSGFGEIAKLKERIKALEKKVKK